MKNKEVVAGSLLVSMPFQGDPNFERTVIFICEHNDEGSFGLVLNKETNLMLSDFDIFEEVNNKFKIYSGGPVELDTIHFLHNQMDLDKAVNVHENIYWGGNIEDLKIQLVSGSVNDKSIRFYLGYSGWSPGQIEDELERNSWIVCNDYSVEILNIEPSKLWKTILKEMGGEFTQLANYPIDPSLN